MDHKILIVDDDPHQRRYLSAILSSLGYGVATASGGIAAVERLGPARRHGITLALRALHMPDLDGIKVLEQVRAGGARSTANPVMYGSKSVTKPGTVYL